MTLRTLQRTCFGREEHQSNKLMPWDNPPTAIITVTVVIVVIISFFGRYDDPMANRQNLIVDSLGNPGLGK